MPLTKTKPKIEADISFMIQILPDHYTCKESSHPGSIHCFSKIGIRKGIDAEDEKAWSLIMKKIKTRFGVRFQEVDHNVCFCHTDFTVCLTGRKLST